MTKQSQKQKFDIAMFVIIFGASLSLPAFATKAREKALQIPHSSPKRKSLATKKLSQIDTTPIQRIDQLNELNTGTKKDANRTLSESSLLAKENPNYDRYLNIAPNTKSTLVSNQNSAPAIASSSLKKSNLLPPKAEKAWSIGLAATHFVPQREERPQVTVSSFSGDYLISKSLNTTWKASADLDYAHVWSKYQDPGTSQVDEIRFELNRTQAVASFSLNMGPVALVPANEFDSKAGFNGALGANFGSRLKLGKAGLIGLSLRPLFYSYKYDTSDLAGLEYNKRSSVEGNVIFAYSFTDKLNWSNLVRLTENWNSIGTQTQTYLLTSGLSYKALENLGFSMGVMSRDRVITTNDAFDENVTTLRFGIDIGL